MLPGTVGLNEGREAHLLDVMKILHNVWNDTEASTIAFCWAKSAILTHTIDGDILAEYANRTKCATSQATKYLVYSIVEAFHKLSLTAKFLYFGNLAKRFYGLASLQQQCSPNELTVKLEQWIIVEVSRDFVELLNKEHEERLSEEAFIASLCKEESFMMSL
jgi:hypothetical protein